MFKNLDKFTQTLTKQIEQVFTNAVKGVEEALKLVEDTSQRYVPIKTKALHNSFYKEVDSGVLLGKPIVGVAGYNKGASGEIDTYAGIMHSGFWPSGAEINYRTTHQPTPQSHFLAKGFLQNRDAVWETVARLMKS